MLQKPEDITQEQFLKDVANIKVRFPVARIAKETGFDKGSVSRYLKGEMLPSANFLKAFYKWLDESSQNVARETIGEERTVVYQAPQTDTALVQSLREQIKILQSHCEFVQKAYEDRLKSIELSLKESLSNEQVLMRQISVATHLAAARYVGTDKKKLQEEIQKINTMIASVKD